MTVEKKPVARKPRAKKLAVEEAAVVIVEEAPAPKKRDFTEAKAKWELGKIDEYNWVERNEFVQTLLGTVGAGTPLEEVVAANPGRSQVMADLKLLANQYIVLRDKSARLPKFGKWVNSLFNSNAEYSVAISKLGQGSSTKGVIISADIVDIVRVGDTKHYWSCLGANGMYKEVMKAVCDRCPGIFLAYIDHDDGKMQGRVFLNHARVDGQDVVVAAGAIYGTGFNLTNLADYFADRGVKLYHYSSGYWGNQYVYNKGKVVQINDFVGCFGKKDANIHYDTPTWTTLGCTEVLPSSQLKKQVA